MKMDSLNSLQIIPNDSLDSIMINNIDSYIVSDDNYLSDLMIEAKRVLKDGGVVFGRGSNWIELDGGDVVYNNRGFKIVQK